LCVCVCEKTSKDFLEAHPLKKGKYLVERVYLFQFSGLHNHTLGLGMVVGHEPNPNPLDPIQIKKFQFNYMRPDGS